MFPNSCKPFTFVVLDYFSILAYLIFDFFFLAVNRCIASFFSSVVALGVALIACFTSSNLASISLLAVGF